MCLNKIHVICSYCKSLLYFWFIVSLTESDKVQLEHSLPTTLYTSGIKYVM